MKSLFIFLFLVVTWPVIGQTVITGKVSRASNGEPLVGATVSVKGSNRGTITDHYGHFRLNVNEAGTIVFSFVGFHEIEKPFQLSATRQSMDVEMVSNDLQLEDVKVAANRVEEYLQKVPVAATVVTSKDMQQRNVYNTMEALNNAPNLITDSWLSSQSSFSIRGLSTVFDNLGFESTVALYIDDVYFSRSFSFNSTLFDVERVEILRGPQGTLFGKNTVGGVIHVISEKPEMTNNGQIELNYGNYNFLQARAKYNVQLIPKKLAWRVTGAMTKRNGYINDEVPAIEAANKTDFYGFRSSLSYTPNDRTEITLRGFYGRDNNAENTFVYASKPDENPLGVPADEGLHTKQNLPNTFYRNQYGVSAKAEFKLNKNTLTIISAYNNSKDDYFGDNDVSRADASRWGRLQELRNISQEIRFSSPRDLKFSYVGGLYYLNERIGAKDTFTLNQDFLQVAEVLMQQKFNFPKPYQEGYITKSLINSSSLAAYFSGSLKLTPKWTLNGGVRFTSEEKKLSYFQTVTRQYINGQPTEIIDLYAVDVASAESPFERKTTDQVFSFDIGTDFKFSPFAMAYLKFVKGFKGAGFNTSVTTDPNGANLVFKPEYVNSYELGLKTKLSERIRFNAAVFYTDYLNKQELLDQGARVTVVNANKTTGWGAEAEFSAMYKRFRVDVSGGWLNLMYKDFPFGEDDNGNPINYAGNKLLKAPNVTFSVAPQYTISLNKTMNLFLGLNINHTGKAYNDISNSEVLARVPATIVNSRISIAPKNGKYSIALWGKNLTNQLYVQHGWEYFWGDQIAWSRPRYMGIEVFLNFF
ncbi:MAG: TonB-dependent receptor [Spirosomataceae bacterium]